ncbi:anti-sigma factor, partial [gut metagenome]
MILGITQIWNYRRLKQVEWIQTETTFGEKKEITLADGSCVILNACSKLQYPNQFTDNYRNIKLNGEAYFQVAPNPDKPFRIKTPHFGVEVLGTKFNVKSYPDDQIQSVEVENGKVQVDLPE